MRGGLIGVGLGLLALSSCVAPATEVVVLIDTDLPPPIEAGSLEITIAAANRVETFRQQIPKFPARLILVPADWEEPLSVTVTLVKCDTVTFDMIVVRQRVSGIHYVHGATRVVGLTLQRACVCQGTACPNPRAVPECADVNNPTTSTLDTSSIPRLPLRTAGQVSQGCGGRRDAGLDLRPQPDVRPEDVADVAAEASSDGGDVGDARGAADADDGDAGDAGTEPDGAIDTKP